MQINNIKTEIAKDNIAVVFDQLKKLFRGQDDFLGLLILQESNWSKLNKNKLKGILTTEQINLEEAKVKNNLLELLEAYTNENPGLLISISPGLLKMLDIVYKNCQLQNVPFQTPHLLNLAMTYPNPKIKEAFAKTKKDAFDKIKNRIDQFLNRQNEKGQPFIPLDWYELESIKTAQKIAATQGATELSAKFLLLGLLNTTSGTLDMIIDILHDRDLLSVLIQHVSNIEENNNRNPDKLKTDI